MQLQSTVKSVTARALQNENQVAILVGWDDATQDDSAIRVQDFRDAAALQFPLAQGQPYFCMGQQGGNVNIWHWKADWQADIAGRQDMESEYPNMYVDEYPFADPEKGVTAGIADYTDPNYVPAMQAGNLFAGPVRITPVEDLIAGGFGSLTAQAIEAQNVRGFGTWQDGKWQVIFSRDLASSEADDVIFNPGKVYSLAFAVWDGANSDRNGQKSTSQWVSLQLAAAPKAPSEAPAAETASPWTSPRNITLMIIGVFALLFIAGFFVYLRLPGKMSRTTPFSTG
jgi:cytochrome b558/566 subunit A